MLEQHSGEAIGTAWVEHREQGRECREKERQSSREGSGQESLVGHARNVRFGPKSTEKPLRMFGSQSVTMTQGAFKKISLGSGEGILDLWRGYIGLAT